MCWRRQSVFCMGEKNEIWTLPHTTWKNQFQVIKCKCQKQNYKILRRSYRKTVLYIFGIGKDFLIKTQKSLNIKAKIGILTMLKLRTFSLSKDALEWNTKFRSGKIYFIFSFFLSFFFFFFFCLFRAAPAAYVSFQARGQIRASASGLRHSHSKAGSKPCLRPIP